MEKEYSINVCMTPSYQTNSEKPYFWVIFEETVGVNTGCSGWAKTPELAWKDAAERFKEEFGV